MMRHRYWWTSSCSITGLTTVSPGLAANGNGPSTVLAATISRLMPRIAFFPDSFHEVNGVAHTARHFVAFAQRRKIPMLCVRAGGLEDKLLQQGSVGILQLDRGYWAVRVEQDLSFDPFFFRLTQAIGKALRWFRPDI